MRSLVTGASGFAGGHLCRLLESRGDVVGGYSAASGPGGAATGRANHGYVGDIRDVEALSSALSDFQPDRVFHLAGQAHVGASWKDATATLAINAIGTQALLEAAAGCSSPARVMLVSSGLVYGRGDGAPVAEDAPLRPLSPYATSKACAEVIARQWADGGVDVVITRPFNFAGPGQSPEFVISDWCRQIARIEKGITPPVMAVGNLAAQRDFTDVRDVVAGFVAALEHGQRGAAYNLCSGRPTAVQTILDELLQRAHCPIEVTTDPARMRPSDQPVFVGNPGRARQQLDWEATIALGQTLDDVLAAWRSQTAVETVP